MINISKINLSQFSLTLVGLIAFLVSNQIPSAFAFPEMIRHGYSNCASCHVSPTGGGLLTEYGRELNLETLENPQRPFFDPSYFQSKLPSGLLVGGDARLLQTVRSDSSAIAGKFFLMHADLEAAVHAPAWAPKLSVLGSIGTAYGSGIGSKKYWIHYRPIEADAGTLSLRAGKFYPNYGLMISDHTASIRQLLGYGPGEESKVVEASWIASSATTFLSGDFERKGLILSQSYTFKEKFKFIFGAQYTQVLKSGGVSLVLGFTPRWYLLSEADLVSRDLIEAGKYRPQSYHLLGYEWTPGHHALITFESTQDISGNSILPGIGYSGFPTQLLNVPFGAHLQFELSAKRKIQSNNSINNQTLILGLLHIFI